MTTERFTTWGNRIKRDGKLLNIEFKTKTDAKLCCKLCNQMDKDNQEYIDKLDEIFKWYKDYYGETILDTKMGWNNNKKMFPMCDDDYERFKLVYDESVCEYFMEDKESKYPWHISTVDGLLNSFDDTQKDLTEEVRELKKENQKLKQELFEAEEEYLLETYHDNPVRRDDKIELLKEEFKERFGEEYW